MRVRGLWAVCALLLSFPLLADEYSSAAALLSGDQVGRLELALRDYEAIEAAAAEAGWPSLPADTQLYYGLRQPTVRILRQRLRLTADYTADMGADPWLFDAGLQAALIGFQQRHGLHPDGIVRGQTLVALNLSPQIRIAQLQHAMHSWAEQQAADAKQTPAARVWINIPEASVTAIANDEIALHMRAVVGHPTRPTPTLSSAISRVIVNPSWTVPPGIAGADVLPRQISDPNYLHDNGFRVFAGWRDDQPELDPAKVNWRALNNAHFPYRLRQNPGPKNSLGRFKFDFPNRHDVSLHDTPVQALLGLSIRSLSAGCIRVENPDALAFWLVGEVADTREKLATAAEDMAYRTRAFKLRAVVPVDLVYLSAWVSANGQVNFRRDVYQLSLPESQRNLFTVAQ